MSAISQDTRLGTAQVEREREKDETRCRRNGRDAQASLARRDPLVPQLVAEPVLEAQEAGVEEAEVEAAVHSPTGSWRPKETSMEEKMRKKVTPKRHC